MKWFACAVLLGSAVARASSPPFSVSVETSWPAPPLLLEILEAAHDEDPASYFPLLRLLTKHTPALGATPTAQAVFERALALIESHGLLAGPSQRDTLQLALALHTPAPRIEAAYQLYTTLGDKALGTSECESWVEWRGKGFCDPDELAADLERSIEEGDKKLNLRPKPQPFDRVSFPGTGPQAVLYYSPTPAALPLLEYLDAHARAHPPFGYVVRYRAPQGERTIRTPLAGYGVEMQLKKTDYLVVDDRAQASGGKQATFSSVNTTGRFESILGDDPWAETATPLTEEQIGVLSLQAVALVKSSKDPLGAFVDLTQDLPKYSAAIARKVTIPNNIRARAERIAMHPFGPSFFINGRTVKDQEIDAFGLLHAVRNERHYMTSLLSLGYSPAQAFDLISDPLIGESQAESDPLEGLVDASDRQEGGKVIAWLNDLENDEAYARWPTSIKGYLRAIYPGQLHLIGRNLWNVVLVLDLATVRGVEAIVGSAGTLVDRQVPIHVGVVPLFTDLDEPSAQMAKLFYHIQDTLGAPAARQLLVMLSIMSPGAQTTIDMDIVRKAYERLQEASEDLLLFDDVMTNEELNERLRAVQEYRERVGATREESASGHVFTNGKHGAYSSHWTQSLQNDLGGQLQHLRSMLQSGATIDEDTISTYFYDLPSTQKRRNKFIIPSSDEIKTFNLLDVFADEASVLSKQFIYPSDEENAGTPLTLWVVGDLDAPESRAVIRNAFTQLKSEGCSYRLGFVHVPTTSAVNPEYRLSTTLYQLMASDSLAHVNLDETLDELDLVDKREAETIKSGKIVQDGEQQQAKAEVESESASEPPLNEFTAPQWSAADKAEAAAFWQAGTVVADRLKLRNSKPHLLVNGRLIGPITAKDFSPEDINALEQYELSKRVHPVIHLVRTFHDDLTAFNRSALADLISATSSIIASSYMPHGAEGIFMPPPRARGRQYEQLDDGDISFAIGNAETALIHVAVIVNPISELAQRWSGLLKLLSRIEHVSITVYLDPDLTAKELSVKRFYRSALPWTLNFDVDGNEVGSAVTFNDLPSSPIFTLSMESPSTWILRPKESPLDLDNLVLGRLYEPTHVLFDLKQLSIDGHAREQNSAPPRGLQLQLKSGDHVVSDTQVMANLGYFQFKATPGVYDLSIRPGRGQEVYELESAGADGWDSPTVEETGATITVASLYAPPLFPRFARRDGMEIADVLEVEPEQESTPRAIVSKMKSMFGLTPSKPKSRHADINIFTVASGLLYERFASIMILSVMKHTKHSVKFWFIENFLSPTFLKFIPHLAKEYGFEYELVTYKWPHWLRAQTEKQRIIWAYKILFLDVLFPMDLDKVIFVDADQIVRVDMNELVEVDLHDHVYGYPPMGDDRTEMEGFRFWKTGYWKKELQGRPYHISALYVVDLKRFRQVAAGDRLRGTYQALSADPGSLANLDQDLPNSMQRTLPIFTLDQDWLWCQTWCSDESLARAKTIDLCQNPLTKEPKLVRARQIPEWDSYDREIAAFAATLETDGGALAGNVDDLAGSPPGEPEPEKRAAPAGEAAPEDAQEPEPSRDTEPAQQEVETEADNEPVHDEL